jgi:hypothetical protein
MSVSSSSSAPMSAGRTSNLTPGSMLPGGNIETTDSRLPAEINPALPIRNAADTSEIAPVGEAAMVDRTLSAEDATETRAAPSVHGAGTGVKADGPRCQCSPKGRNLIVCIDGTANQFGMKVGDTVVILSSRISTLIFQNTNVVELYSRLVNDEDQLTYYDSGIGTYVKESFSLRHARQVVDHAIDMAIAW